VKTRGRRHLSSCYERNIITEGLYLLVATMYGFVVFGQHNDISCVHMLYSNYMVLYIDDIF